MPTLFYILFFFTPLVLWPYTSELFEFNKMIFVYAMTAIIVATWLSRCLAAKKFIFRRTILDIPLLAFLGSQLLSTLFSIDPRTSWLGYYSRFNGGLLSTISYLLLYWAFVSNMNREKVVKSIHFLFYSSAVVSLIAFLEHFGINITCAFMGQGFSSCWIQDVQNRVFGTLGQPNWLATWIVALIPLTLYQILESKNIKRILLYLLSLLLFATLLFTKSRSAFLGFFAADLIFWAFVFVIKRKKALAALIISNLLFGLLFLAVSTPWNPAKIVSAEKVQGPALETGGTESGTIRKIVWKGALQVWLHYPIFGSGVETFAYSYYQFRPVEHNLVSEWDFLYNKAHNEYLNMAATTGTVGLGSYLALIAFSVYLFWKSKNFSLLAGYISILVSNFFGFSVVATQLLLFLFPAMAITLRVSEQRTGNSLKTKLSNNQKVLIVATLLAVTYTLSAICKYWYADILYAKKDILSLEKAVKISPREAIFHNQLALNYADQGNASAAISQSSQALALSPVNLNILRSRASVFIKLSALDLKYLGFAKEALLLAAARAPTDAKILYNLALVYLRTGETEAAVDTLQKAIEMKPNYEDVKYWLNLLEKAK